MKRLLLLIVLISGTAFGSCNEARNSRIAKDIKDSLEVIVENTKATFATLSSSRLSKCEVKKNSSFDRTAILCFDENNNKAIKIIVKFEYNCYEAKATVSSYKIQNVYRGYANTPYLETSPKLHNSVISE